MILNIVYTLFPCSDSINRINAFQQSAQQNDFTFFFAYDERRMKRQGNNMQTFARKIKTRINKPFVMMATIIITLCLTSCANVSPAIKQANNQNLAWQARHEALATIHGWTLNGGIAIRHNSDAWSANVHVQQSAINQYRIDFIAPLGAGTLRLIGTPELVTFLNEKGQKSTAHSAEALIKKQMGWTLPVTNMYYWLRGIPAPDFPAKKFFDNVHHLTRLTQQGWTIRFERYTAVGKFDLPSKIIMKRQGLVIKMIINTWRNLQFVKQKQANDASVSEQPKNKPKTKPLIDLLSSLDSKA